jgi:hypothetical protein
LVWEKAVALSKLRIYCAVRSDQHGAVEELTGGLAGLERMFNDETICFRNLTLEPDITKIQTIPERKADMPFAPAIRGREPVRVVVHLGGHAIAAPSQASRRAFGT